MDALQAHGVHEAPGVAGDERAVGVHARHRVPAAFRQRLGAVAHEAAAVEQTRDQGMALEPVERDVRVEQRVVVVEPHHEAERHQPIGERVDEAAAELLVPQRMPERVHHGAGLDAPLRHFPQLLEPDGELLGLAPLTEGEVPPQLLGEVAAHAVAEDRDLGVDVHARLERGLLLAVLPAAAVAGADADHALAVEQHLLAGEAGEEVDAGGLGLLRHPASELVERHEGVAVVGQRRRNERGPERAVLGEEVHALAADHGEERRAKCPVVRQQLREGRQVEHGARQQVGAGLARLLEHRDRWRPRRPAALASCDRRIAADSPAGPPPTIRTSTSRVSRATTS